MNLQKKVPLLYAVATPSP